MKQYIPSKCYNTRCSNYNPNRLDNCGHPFLSLSNCPSAEAKTVYVDKDPNYYEEVLESDECICGQDKNTGMPFCNKCYFTLPRYARPGLYKQVGRGFEESYEAAVQILTEEGRV